MRRLLNLLAIACLLTALLLPVGTAFGQPTAPSPTLIAEARFEVTGLPPQFDIYQRVIDFAPGVGTPRHFHGGPQIGTVLDGTLNFRILNVEHNYKAGESWLEPSGAEHAGRNLTSTTTRLVASAFVAPGVAMTTNTETPAPGQATITVVQESKFTATGQPATLDIVQRVLDFAPGAVAPDHYHPGVQFVTVMEGEITLRLGGIERVYRSGDSWTEPANAVHLGVNRSGNKTRVLTTALLPKGAAHSTPATTPQVMPTTGATPVSVGILIAMLGGLAALGGLHIRERSSLASDRSF